MDQATVYSLLEKCLDEPFKFYDMLILDLAAKTHDGKYPYGYDFYIRHLGKPQYGAGRRLLVFREKLRQIRENGRIVNPIPVTPENLVWKETDKLALAFYLGFSHVPVSRTVKHHELPRHGEDWLAANFSPQECKEIKKHVPDFRERVLSLFRG